MRILISLICNIFQIFGCGWKFSKLKIADPIIIIIVLNIMNIFGLLLPIAWIESSMRIKQGLDGLCICTLLIHSYCTRWIRTALLIFIFKDLVLFNLSCPFMIIFCKFKSSFITLWRLLLYICFYILDCWCREWAVLL